MTEAPLRQPNAEGPGTHILSSSNPLAAAWGYSALSACALANSLLWNSIHPLLLPVIVLALAGEEVKNSVLGAITFAGLIVAMVAQPLWGALSDRTRTPWGRRRPFIAAGALGTVLLVAFLAQAGSLAALLAVYVVLQLIFNSSLAAYQGLIPDLVPPGRRGIASGAKNFAEILGLIVAALVIPTLIAGGDVLPGFAFLIAVLAAATAITCLAIPERKPRPEPSGLPLPPGEGQGEGPAKGRGTSPRATGSGPRTQVPGHLSPKGEGDEGLTLASLRDAFRVSPRRHADFFWMLAGRLLFVLAMTSIQTFSLFYIRDVLQPAETLALWRDLTASIGVSILLVTLPGGYLADRLGRRPIILLAGAVAGAAALLLLGATEPAAVLLYGTLVGVGIGLFLTANWALATDLIPPGEGARFMGLTNLATAGGAALARLNGPAIDALNAATPLLGYRFLLLAVGVAFLAGALLVLKVHEPPRARLQLPLGDGGGPVPLREGEGEGR